MTLEERIDELVDQLNAASVAYYGGGKEIMTDFEWDKAFDQLAILEEETGYIRDDSPTLTVSYSGSLRRKITHEFPALSLAKTKSVYDLQKWAQNYPIWISWKLDGLTLVLTYDNGRLTSVATRGNGIRGDDVTYMKDCIVGFPTIINYKGHMIVRGECMISYKDFEEINENLASWETPYANPRNLASGTLAMGRDKLDIIKSRHLAFQAFCLVYRDDIIETYGKAMQYLRNEGFATVEAEATIAFDIPKVVERWTRTIESGAMKYPADGLVICYDDIPYSRGGSSTGHHAIREGYAYKWPDKAVRTTLRYIDWCPSANSINPVAVFDAVQIEGTTVRRASLTNLSEIARLGIGGNNLTEVEVIKANKIIPKIVNVVSSSGEVAIPKICPACGHKTTITISANGVQTLECTNPDCAAKNVKKFVRFASRSGMNIVGLAEETIRKLIASHLLNSFIDIYALSRHEIEITGIEGFGEKKTKALLMSINSSRVVEAAKLLNALSIPGVSLELARNIVGYLGWQEFLNRVNDHTGFEDIPGIGTDRSNAIRVWFADGANYSEFLKILDEVTVEEVENPFRPAESGMLTGMSFAISGSLDIYENREALEKVIAREGGKVVDKVTESTTFVICNDPDSSSSKVKNARSLCVPVISEIEFQNIIGSSR